MLILSSGPWGWRAPWKWFVDWEDFDYVVTKTSTFSANKGNGPLYKTLRLKRGGVINRLGLPNNGIWAAEEIYKSLPKAKQSKTIVSLATGPRDQWGSPIDFLHMFQSITPLPPMFELNISCPSAMNTGEFPFNYPPDGPTRPDPWQRFFDGCIYKSSGMMLLKVSVDTPLLLIEKALHAGFAGIVASNSHPILLQDGSIWGLSGPEIFYRNLNYVSRLRKNFPEARIIAGGGIYGIKEAFLYLNAGANGLALGSVFLRHPARGRRIAKLLKINLSYRSFTHEGKS